jgi:hypothetical protein
MEHREFINRDIQTLNYCLDYFQFGTELERTMYDERMVVTATIDQGIVNLQTMPKLALFWAKATIDIMTDSSCDFTEIPDFEFHSPIAIYMKQNSSYGNVIDYQ